MCRAKIRWCQQEGMAIVIANIFTPTGVPMCQVIANYVIYYKCDPLLDCLCIEGTVAGECLGRCEGVRSVDVPKSNILDESMQSTPVYYSLTCHQLAVLKARCTRSEHKATMTAETVIHEGESTSRWANIEV